MAGRCLFCRQPLEGDISPEHIIPESLGGWLTIYDVCNACNHRLGHDVDKVVNNRTILELRREAGLKVPAFLLKSESVDEELKAFGPWIRRTDDMIEWSRDVVFTGNQVEVLGYTIEEAWAKDERITTRRVRQGRSRIEFIDVDETDFGVRRFLSEPTEEEVEEFNDLLIRELAKMAIEYISMIANPEVALLSCLDHIRSCASADDECGLLEGGSDYVGEGIRWLPRTRQFMALP
jgi:hypothetical protein